MNMWFRKPAVIAAIGLGIAVLLALVTPGIQFVVREIASVIGSLISGIWMMMLRLSNGIVTLFVVLGPFVLGMIMYGGVRLAIDRNRPDGLPTPNIWHLVYSIICGVLLGILWLNFVPLTVRLTPPDRYWPLYDFFVSHQLDMAFEQPAVTWLWIALLGTFVGYWAGWVLEKITAYDASNE